MTMFRKVFIDRMSTDGTAPQDETPISPVEHPKPVLPTERPASHLDDQIVQVSHGASTPVEQPDIPDRAAHPAPTPPILPPPMQSTAIKTPPMQSAVPEAAVGRARTRLLGFAPTGVEDPFEMVGKGTVDDLFPAGWLVIIAGPGAGHHFAVTSGVTTIGRGTDQGISLSFGDTAISRSNHASVAYDPVDNACYLGHGGKSNIIRLNDRPVLSTETLASGDIIRIGETILRFAAFCGTTFNWENPTDV